MYNGINGEHDIISNNIKNKNSYTSNNSSFFDKSDKGNKIVYKRERFMSENCSHPSFQIINYYDLEIETNYATNISNDKKEKKSDIYVNNNFSLNVDQLGFNNDYKAISKSLVESNYNMKSAIKEKKEMDNSSSDIDTSFENEKSNNNNINTNIDNNNPINHNNINKNSKEKCEILKKKINMDEIKKKAEDLKDLLNKSRKNTL